jgi:alpha-tubulin suppressor-like RCC1 family protein
VWRYNGCVASKGRQRFGRALSVLAIAPLCAWLGCGDVSNDPVAGAGTGGEEPASAGHGGESVTAAGGADASGGEAGSTGPSVRTCASDADCDASRFCAGAEICVEIDADTGIGYCHAAPVPPCSPEDCDEASRTCDCLGNRVGCAGPRGDCDNDGAYVPYCAQELGEPEDCDDNDPDRHPNKMEACDDDDRDEDCNDTTYGERDDDDDQHVDGDCANFSLRNGLFNHGDDCDDGDDERHPGAKEICDNKDNDCNGITDEVFGTPSEDINYYYLDSDGDGWGDDEERQETRCDHSPFDDHIPQRGDCNDGDADVNPGREELCNGIDDDCDRRTDETPLFNKPVYEDTEFECRAGEWKVVSCPTQRLDCDPWSGDDGCETDANTLCNCRACGNRCEFSCGESGCEEIVTMSMGYSHTCAIAAPPGIDVSLEGGKAVCWGRNQSGQVGADPGVVREAHFAGAVTLNDVKAIAMGRQHSCAIAGAQNTVFCWGDNAYGKLGTSEADPELFTPVAAFRPGVTFVSIATGWDHTCAVANDGALYCWGRGGRLGIGRADGTTRPEPVVRRPGLENQFVDDAKSVVAGHEHGCLLTTAGVVECWGENNNGQLGDGLATPNSLVAKRVAGLTLVDSLCAGPEHTCAVSGGQVYCWGDNIAHQLGTEGSGDGLPHLVAGISGAIAITCGANFTCALNAANQLTCWGGNQSGQTGSRDLFGPTQLNSSPMPSVVEGEFSEVFGGGGYHVCAKTTQGQSRCWGDNAFGQLGIGSADPEPHPVPVAFLGLDGAVCQGTTPSQTKWFVQDADVP